MRSRMPAEEEIPPVHGFSAPERRLTGKQRPPDFSLLKKQRPIRSYSSDEQTTRQAGSKRAVCSKASKSVLQGYSGQALQWRPYGAAHRRPPDSGSGFPGDSRYSPFLPGRQQHRGNRSGTREARRARAHPGCGADSGDRRRKDCRRRRGPEPWRSTSFL